jgi:hypothetical protein
MSLLNDSLSVWEIGFRWASLDPSYRRLRVPLPVRDNFRTMMDAILSCHLPCTTLYIEKYQGTDRQEARLFIRSWLDDINDCIEGQSFDRKLLKWARIERWALQQWCERRRIPLPEFWFPPGWALEYRWAEETLLVPDQGDESEALAHDVQTPEPDDSPPVSSVVFPTDYRFAERAQVVPDFQADDAPARLRENQKTTIACQQVAINLWKLHPDLTIAAMVKHEAIDKFCGGRFYSFRVVRKWLSAVAPPEIKSRVGRPKSKIDIEDNN